MISVCGGRTKYPNPDATLPAWSLEAYTDAAGGTSASLGAGCGVVVGSWWAYLPWPYIINNGGTDEGGKQFARKLSALELVGPLVVVCGAPNEVRGKPVKIYVDNAGSVGIYEKGYSTSCSLSSTLVRAIYQVATALECRVDIVKIARCSNIGSIMADSLSKAAFINFMDTAARAGLKMNENAGKVPEAVKKWLEYPCDDWYLGERILKEIMLSTNVMGYSLKE